MRLILLLLCILTILTIYEKNENEYYGETTQYKDCVNKYCGGKDPCDWCAK